MALTGAVLTLLISGSAWAAFQALPSSGTQVNDDPAAGIDPARDAGVSDVTGGALVAGKPAVPWATFEQRTGTEQQVFVRAFKGGAWVTQGHGRVGGIGPSTIPGSLNYEQTTDGEAPSIDFAGPGRTVPWATWYEQNSLFGKEQIFASRFDAAQDKWVFAGQKRGGVVPSLNIDTAQDAENPSVAGGSADPTKPPGPWIAWQEQAGGHDQIFVAKPIKLDAGSTTCPVGTKPAGAAAIGGFCFQQVGVERVAGEPSLNADPARAGIEPDIAFTGPGDTVPWVVWYETGGGRSERVFAAKAVAGTTGVRAGDVTDGGFHWQAVGNGTAGKPAQVLDTTDVCEAASPAPAPADQAEQDCALNKDPGKDAEDPRIAAGTMVPGNPTVPWAVWAEQSGGVEQIFASRLVGGNHFALVNSGQPLSLGANDSTRPDITFSHNTPYVSWREQISGGEVKVFTGHFVNLANPTFVIDNPGGTSVTAAGAQADVRAPISSACTANPFNADGSTCQGAAIGSPFFLFTDGKPAGSAGGPQKLIAQAYKPDAPVTGAASAITTTTAHIAATVNPQGGPVEVGFQYGTTTAYGSSTAVHRLAPANALVAYDGALAGLPASTTIHYRALARSDFGTLYGADRTLRTATPPDTTAPHVTLKLKAITVAALLRAGKLRIKVTVDEAAKVTLSASRGATKLAKGTVRITRAGSRTATLTLTHAGRRALRHRRHVALTLKARAADAAGNARTRTVHVSI